MAIPEALPVAPSGGRGRFLGGLVVGAVLALAGAAGWWAWGPLPVRAAAVDQPAPAAGVADAQGADERARTAEETARQAREAARQAEAERAATEQMLTTVRNQVQAALGQLAAAESGARTAQEQATALEKAAGEAEARLAALKGKEADAGIAKTRAAAQQAEAQRAAAERALVDVRNRLQAAQAKHGEAERQLAAANTPPPGGPRPGDRPGPAGGREARPARRGGPGPGGQKRPPGRAARRPAGARPGPRRGQGPGTGGRAEAEEAPSSATGWSSAPFPAPDRKGHDKAFPPEADPFDPKKEYDAAGHKVAWKAHAGAVDYVDMAELFKTQDPSVAYAVCWVRASRARSIALSLGSNDGLKVWVGGKLVIDRPVSRSAAPGQDRATCTLADGWNEVRVKVDNTGGPWGFYLEPRDPGSDRPLAGLEVRTTPPDKGRK